MGRRGLKKGGREESSERVIEEELGRIERREMVCGKQEENE